MGWDRVGWGGWEMWWGGGAITERSRRGGGPGVWAGGESRAPHRDTGRGAVRRLGGGKEDRAS